MNTKRRAQGFTLVEVVVALAVVVVAFMAMYGSLQQMVLAATSMQEKTFASWVAYDQITELRVKGDFPDGEKREGEVEMAGVVWLYSMEFNKNTESNDLLQVIVRVKPEYAPGRVVGLATGALIRAQGTTTPPGGPSQPNVRVGADSGAALILSGPTDGSPVAGPAPGQTDPSLRDGVLE